MAHSEVTPVSGVTVRAAHEVAHLLMAAVPLLPVFGLVLAGLVIRARRRASR